MKNKQTKTKPESGPWASISEIHAQMVQDAVEEIKFAATHYKGTTDADETVPMEELIDVFEQLAEYAFVCLLQLKSTSSKKNSKSKPGPFAHISEANAKYIRKLIKMVQELAVDGLRMAKQKKNVGPNKFFGHFSMIKKYAGELEGFLGRDDEEETTQNK